MKLRRALSLLSFVLLLGTSVQQAQERPNILYIYVDDMGWGSIGPNGQNARRGMGLPYLITPNLDQLASEGINFSRSYGCTVCSPARSSQQLGFHQGHTFADQNDPDNAKKAMRADDITMGDALSKAGYVTGYWGKWGYGGSRDQDSPKILNVQTLPTSHGYQHVLAELHHVRAHTFFQPTLWKAPAAPGSLGGLELIPNSLQNYRGRSEYPEKPSLHNRSDYPDISYCDDHYAFAALDFVRSQSRNYIETGQPFFGLLAFQVPHAPFHEIESLPKWRDVYKDHPQFDSLPQQAQNWAAMITRIDGHIGNILGALEDPNGDGDFSDSVAEKTLVVFQSDNGGPNNPCREVFASNGVLSGQKGTIQEGGIRIPTMIRPPEAFIRKRNFSPGSSTDKVIDVTDLLPTFCELARTDPPLGIDGVSIAPALLGTGFQRPRAFLIHEAGNGKSIIRGKFKLVLSKKATELFNLELDPMESENIASDHPSMVSEMKALLIGERVEEPKGFANTYHNWEGKSGGDLSSAENWSDYVYANAGVTYMKDNGGPSDSWIALLENSGVDESLALADNDVEFLGIEVRGGRADQILEVREGTQLTGRNEIRISERGRLVLGGGILSSLRWVEVRQGGVLSGGGTVDANLYNSGSVSIGRGKVAQDLIVNADYIGFSGSKLKFEVKGKGVGGKMRVEGVAQLDGLLAINLESDIHNSQGSRLELLSAKEVRGRFANPGGEVIASDGSRWLIEYLEQSVSLRLR